MQFFISKSLKVQLLEHLLVHIQSFELIFSKNYQQRLRTLVVICAKCVKNANWKNTASNQVQYLCPTFRSLVVN